MAEFNKEGKVSVWKKEAKSGLSYMSGTITINGVDHNFSLFENDNKVAGDKKPDFTGKIRVD
ncbi:MAG: hypothetical protein RR744_00345 [Cellulosilyticaceae bacterium]